MPTRPNVIYLHSHDTGRRIGPYGYAVDTPNLNRFARGATIFRKAFCAAPTCSPSRAALLTGQAPHSAGMLGLHHRGFELTDPTQHLCHTMKRAGYATTLIGVNHVISDVHAAGYDRSVPLASSEAEDVAPAAADFLANAPAEPFFLDVGFVQTHRGRFRPLAPEDDPRFAQPIDGLPDELRTREDAMLYAGAARVLDRGIGQVLDALDRSGLAGRTLVICTTDHGISFPRHKCTLFDGGMEVMLLIRGPATPSLPGGIGDGVSDALVSQIDLFPTLCDYLAIAPPPWLQGKSLLPVLRGEAADVNDAVFGEISYHAAYQPERAVRTKRYKYVRRFGEARPQPLSNLDDGLSKTVYVEHGHATREQPPEALYDLIFDPSEQTNLIHDPSMQSVLTESRSRLSFWMRETNDPLLQGAIPLPEGAFANTPDDYSAKDALARQQEKTRA